MNSSSDTPAPESRTWDPAAGGHGPANWREAFFTLIASRLTLLQLESRQFAKANANRAIAAISAVICIFFTWALILAGGIAAISHASGMAWYWICLITAALHLLATLLFLKCARSPSAPALPITRAEFQKDREWIENFQKTPKSNG